MAVSLRIGLVVLLVTLLLPGPFAAQGEENLDDILKGFESESASGEDFQDVLEGFGDGAGGSQNGKPDKMTTEDVLEGFENDETTAAPDSEKQTAPAASRFSLDGYLKLSSVYSFHSHRAAGTDTSWKGLNRLRPEVKLELDADLSERWQARIAGYGFYDFAFAVNDRDDYSDDVLDHYENEVEFGEVYLQGSITEELDLKAGRQIVVWGRSDNIRITDVLNPLDLRWPGLVDIEKLRLPATMTKLDYYFGGWNLSTIALHEVRYNKNPEFGSDFYPAAQPLPDRRSPAEGFALEDTQFAASLSGIFSGWDLSLYFADIYAQLGLLSPRAGGAAPRFEIKHPRVWMLGGAFNLAWGNWLFKTEAAYFDGFEFTATPGTEYARLDALIGAEYTGLSDAAITLELANRHIFDFDRRLEDSPDFQKEDLLEWALRISKPYLNDTLNLTVLVNFFGFSGDDGAFERFSAEYDLTDSIQLTGGVVFYQSGDLRRTRDIGDNDSIFFEVQYNF